MDCEQYKLFVGGIPRETSEESLRQHFSRYGLVLGALVAKEKATGQPRGFAFVRFANAFDVDKALSDSHFILGRAVDVKKAIPKYETVRYQQPNGVEVQQYNGGDYSRRTKKLFVGGLSSDTTEEEFKGYFEKFGQTTDVVVMHDSVTNRPRGFGFVTYESEESVEVVMQSNFHELSNKRVEVKRAIPKEGIQSTNNGYHLNIPPTYNNFQATPYAPGTNGYGMLVQSPPVIGYHYHGVPSFQYPYSYPFTAQALNIPWNNMPLTGFYGPPPPSDIPPYLPYMNGYGLTGMNVAAYNPLPWPVAADGVGAMIPRFEDLKLGGVNMVKPLANGTYR